MAAFGCNYQGDIALNTENPTEALALFRAATDRDQACMEPWLGQGKALVRLNRPAEAIECFEKAAKIGHHCPYRLPKLITKRMPSI